MSMSTQIKKQVFLCISSNTQWDLFHFLVQFVNMLKLVLISLLFNAQVKMSYSIYIQLVSLINTIQIIMMVIKSTINYA